MSSRAIMPQRAAPAAGPAPAPGRRDGRLPWLDVVRLLAILQILGFHWLRTCFDTGRFGLTWSPAYQAVGIGFGQLHYLLIDHAALSPSSVVNDAIGLGFGLGWEAVNVFILLSGLGLAMHYHPARAGFSLGAWYSHRFRRILVPFYSVAFPMLIAGEAFMLAASGHGGVLGTLSAKIAGKNLTEPLPVELLTHLFLFDPRQAHWAVRFFAPAWWFIPPLLIGYLCFPLLWRLIERIGLLPMLAASLAVSVLGYSLSSMGEIVWNGWYCIVFHELFTFMLGIAAGRMLAREPGRERLTRFIGSPAALAVGGALFVLGNVANWFTWSFPVASALLSPGLALLLAYLAVWLARLPPVLALCRAIDPFYLYLLHQPFVLPVALLSALAAGGAAHSVGFGIGFCAYFIVAACVVLAFQLLVRVVGAALHEMSEGFTRRTRREAGP